MSEPIESDPIARFTTLLQKARATPSIIEPTAMSLASVDAEGRPSVRVLLLKGVDARGLVFYTNLQSRKGREILLRPDVCANFWWAPLEVQVRFEGPAAQVPDAEADAYFASRPRGSQLGAWASDQSRPLRAREELEARLAEVTRKYEGRAVPRPPHWSGFVLAPRAVEFWRNRPDRLHHRELYTRVAADQPWRMQLLYP
jgi:pyridoxamine 5'-phosphate oxidase